MGFYNSGLPNLNFHKYKLQEIQINPRMTKPHKLKCSVKNLLKFKIPCCRMFCKILNYTFLKKMIWNKQFKKARKSDKKARTRNKIFFPKSVI